MSVRTLTMLVLLGVALAGCTRSVPATTTAGQDSTPAWIDVHTHASNHIVSIDQAGGSREDLATCVTEACLESLISIMDEVGTRLAVLMPPPATAGASSRHYESDLATAARQHYGQLLYLGGGSALNAMLHQTVQEGRVSDARRADFEQTANGILADGAVGFGEIAILHLSASTHHAFEEAPADHELLLLLADIAAANRVPIDIHMDPVLADKSTPPEILERSSQNPRTLKGNITPFETLLAHNRGAPIVWAHTADTTGDLSVALVRRLLAEHENLYLSLRLALPRGPLGGERDNILDGSGTIQAEWMSLLQDYPDRFVIGSDTFWGENETGASQTLVAAFLAQLPEEVAQRVACSNAVDIYRLDLACP